MINLSKESSPLFLCKWNGEEIVEIHSIESFYEQYKDTNVFEEEEEFVEMFGETMNEVFNRLEIDQIDTFDNMQIQRIK